ncbi:MAG: adenosylmethionine--8-amino-7-oxononanoate transaminase [Thermoanaerobacteraceae bacterium]|nr:adenosylmethionine--8-amino-7-oxononanoate transaminase [Thermoanaerobacteraceae bacterium]
MQRSYPGTAQLEQWDKQYVWHPFTPMERWCREDQLVIERGEGCYLYDTEGNRYLDGISSLWVTVHGHNHPELNKAIKEQVDKISHSTLLGLANVPATLLAKELVEITPEGLDRVFYSDAGATAVEIAIKIAYQYWQQKDGGRYRQKTKFISLGNAYHGDTIGSVSVGAIDLFHKVYHPLLFDCYTVPSPYCYRCPFEREQSSCNRQCFRAAEETIAAHAEEVAAFIIEPLVQGAAGIITAPEGYLRHVADACKRHNVLLIADEVAVGFGRTGKMFACEHEGVNPDIMCLAKGITGGYLPLAATLTTEEIYRAFVGRPEEGKTFYHGHTYTGNPVASAAALANLRLFKETGLIEKLPGKIAALKRGLEKIARLPHVGEVRQRGMMVGIELVADRATKEPYAVEKQVGHQVVLAARKRGVIVRPLGDVLVLMPILAMTEEQLMELTETVYIAITEVTGGDAL